MDNKEERIPVTAEDSAPQAVENPPVKDGGFALFIKKLARFDIAKAVFRWWKNESLAAKVSFRYALIIGFVSHMFIYTGRYHGRDDMSTIFSRIGLVETGRWFNGRIMPFFEQGYIMPLTIGLLVSFFLAGASFYVCRIFNVEKKLPAFFIGALLATFPSIANTNLFLHESHKYHFAVLMAVVAVFITIRYKFGFLPGAVLAMLTLATYQAKFHVIIVLCVLYLLYKLLLLEPFKSLKFLVLRFSLLGVLGMGLYAVSLPISMRVYNTTYNGYRGFSPDGIAGRMLSVSGIKSAVKMAYVNIYEGFFSNFYLVSEYLKWAYIFLAALALLFLVLLCVRHKIYKQVGRLASVVLMLLALPIAANATAIISSSPTHGLMIYSFVLLPVFCVVLWSLCRPVLPIVKSIFVLAMLTVLISYISGNNIYYLKAHYVNQRTYSFTVRVLERVEPLLPLTTSNKMTLFGVVPSEYLPSPTGFGSHIRDGSGATSFFISTSNFIDTYSATIFGLNIDRNHGVRLPIVTDETERQAIQDKMLAANMPVWPAEGSVDIIDDVVVVNFGLTGIDITEDETGTHIQAVHWVSEGHAEHKYEYHWNMYYKDKLRKSIVTETAQLEYDFKRTNDHFRLELVVKNLDRNYSYSKAVRELTAEEVERLRQTASADSES